MKICPEVDREWSSGDLLDLDWLKRHIPTCPVCQRIMSQMEKMFEELDEEDCSATAHTISSLAQIPQ